MDELKVHDLLETKLLSVSDVCCNGMCKHKSEEECAHSTHLVFPYRGVYVRHVGQKDVVAESNQVLFFNAEEAYRISHPIDGGDGCLSIRIDDEVLRELIPKNILAQDDKLKFREQRRRIDSRTQALAAVLRYGMLQNSASVLEAETLALTLIRRALGENTSHGPKATANLQKLVDRTKLLLSSDVGKAWTLENIGKEIGVSPVYLTQAFQKVERLPLYRYVLRLRLAKALSLLEDYDDLTQLGLELGFSSHSHFSAAFKQAYGKSPSEFQRSVQLR